MFFVLVPVRTVRAGLTHVSRLLVDGTTTGHQCADDRPLLYARGVPRELYAPVQPASVDETEQEAEVPRRRLFCN